ncbi:MAG: TolC family protein [Gemmataceae bacterium]
MTRIDRFSAAVRRSCALEVPPGCRTVIQGTSAYARGPLWLVVTVLAGCASGQYYPPQYLDAIQSQLLSVGSGSKSAAAISLKTVLESESRAADEGVDAPSSSDIPRRTDVEEGIAEDAVDQLPPPRPLNDEDMAAMDPPSRGLSLDQVIQLCLLADPQLRAGFEAINQAHADALTAALKPNPELFADMQLLPLTRPFTQDAEGGPPQTDYLVAFPIDWLLFGKRAAAMASAATAVRVSESEFANLIRERVLEASEAYYDVLETKSLVRLARQNVANLERVEQITRNAVAAGGRPQVELSRVRLDLLQMQQELRDAEAELVKAKAALRALLGQSDADPDFDVSGTLDADLTLQPLPPEEAYQLAVRNRPDLQAARWRMAEASANVDVERRNAYPEIKPFAGYTRQFQQKVLGQPDAHSWTFGLEMPLPFFDRNQGNRAKAVSVLAQSHYEWQSALVELRAEIESVTVEFRTAWANAESVAGEQLRLAQEVRDSLNKAYQAGARPLLDVLDAQRQYNETYSLFITSRANYWRAVYRFNAAIGKQVTPQ